MIEIIQGNLLDAEAEALVNTVNSVGVMGKGIALQFKNTFPDNFEAYYKACKAEQVAPGRMFVYDLGKLLKPRYIINFPTKRHWKGYSRLEDIESGLSALVTTIEQYGIRSIAVPPLGCGHGGLSWSIVRPLIEKHLSGLDNVQVLLYAPSGAPMPEDIKIRSKRPRMTAARSAVLGLMSRYGVPGYRMTLLEVQKLVYFLKVSGEPLEKLEFTKHKYGPYADTLRHVLAHLEGHFISGCGDDNTRPEIAIHLLDGAAKEAEEFLSNYQETRQRFDRVADLIEGFETSYGMELLSTTHWIATKEDSEAKTNVDRAIVGVHEWSDLKKRFKPEHIKAAWLRLREMGWLSD